MFAMALFGSCNKPGCTDPDAVNYDSSANDEDGTCQYIPTVSTMPITSKTANSATCGGIISSDGGQEITVRGVCWSTSPNPTISNDTTINGTGIGAFSSNLSDLSTLTTYYYRAYATNSNGTGYGNELSFTTNPEIGMSFQGGIVFYLDGNLGGLIAAPTDQSSGAEWGCQGTTIGYGNPSPFPGFGGQLYVYGDSIGTGYQNTIDIEAGCTTPGIAADICANLTLGGFNDWFLPSRLELVEMYKNIGPGNMLGLGNIGSFTNELYWSSSEVAGSCGTFNPISGGCACFVAFNGPLPGTSSIQNKSSLCAVRAIRAF